MLATVPLADLSFVIRSIRMRSRFSTFRMALAFFFCATAFVSESKAATIAFWSGNGNANDSVNGQNGTLENGAGFAAGQFGQQAFSLSSGSSQYVSVPDSAAIPSIAAPLTIGQTGEGIGFVDGRLQNVAIADQALSASEITALVTPVPEPSTIVSWMIASGAWGVHRFCRRLKRATRGG